MSCTFACIALSVGVEAWSMICISRVIWEINMRNLRCYECYEFCRDSGSLYLLGVWAKHSFPSRCLRCETHRNMRACICCSDLAVHAK